MVWRNVLLPRLVDKSDAVKPLISLSDEDNANEQMNVIEDETMKRLKCRFAVFSIASLV